MTVDKGLTHVGYPRVGVPVCARLRKEWAPLSGLRVRPPAACVRVLILRLRSAYTATAGAAADPAIGASTLSAIR